MFNEGQAITLLDVLNSKEVRSQRQQALQAKYADKVVCAIKLNIPGVIKTNNAIVDIFMNGWDCIITELTALNYHIETTEQYVTLPTGPEGFIVLDGALVTVKKTMIGFESTLPLGRLFDIDVMSLNTNQQLSRQALGLPARRCLICDNDAKVCAKAQTHSYQAILAKIEAMYTANFCNPQWSHDQAINFAQRGLLYEVSLAPKPGLVDPVSTGAHNDMDVFTFINSSLALQPYFNQAYALGYDFTGNDLTQLFAQLRAVGKTAETVMFDATHGINTHKGAIFSMGILLAATGYCYRLKRTTLTQLQATVTGMLTTLLAQDFNQLSHKTGLTAGEQQFLQYHVTGIRGEAAAGYPTVFSLALSKLAGTTGSIQERLLDTLMYIASQTQDSNLIKRAGDINILNEMRAWGDQYFKLGGSHTKEGIAFLQSLDTHFKQRNLSLGGSADLLILTIYIGLLQGII